MASVPNPGAFGLPPENPTTAADFLLVAYHQACRRLAELDTVPLTERARMTYTADNGQSFDWNGYRRSLQEQIERLPKLMAQAAGPWTFDEWR